MNKFILLYVILILFSALGSYGTYVIHRKNYGKLINTIVSFLWLILFLIVPINLFYKSIARYNIDFNFLIEYLLILIWASPMLYLVYKKYKDEKAKENNQSEED